MNYTYLEVTPRNFHTGATVCTPDGRIYYLYGLNYWSSLSFTSTFLGDTFGLKPDHVKVLGSDNVWYYFHRHNVRLMVPDLTQPLQPPPQPAFGNGGGGGCLSPAQPLQPPVNTAFRILTTLPDGNTIEMQMDKLQNAFHTEMVNMMCIILQHMLPLNFNKVMLIDDANLGELFKYLIDDHKRLVVLVTTEDHPMPTLPVGFTTWERVVIITLQGTPSGRNKMDDLVIAALIVAICHLKLDLEELQMVTCDVKIENSRGENDRLPLTHRDLGGVSQRPGENDECWISMGAAVLLLHHQTNTQVVWYVKGHAMENLVSKGLTKYPNLNSLGILAKRLASESGDLMNVSNPDSSWRILKNDWLRTARESDKDARFLYLLLSDVRAFRPSGQVSLVNALGSGLGTNAFVSEDMKRDLVRVLIKLMPDELIVLMNL
jgi:hypothetical protein